VAELQTYYSRQRNFGPSHPAPPRLGHGPARLGDGPGTRVLMRVLLHRRLLAASVTAGITTSAQPAVPPSPPSHRQRRQTARNSARRTPQAPHPPRRPPGNVGTRGIRSASSAGTWTRAVGSDTIGHSACRRASEPRGAHSKTIGPRCSGFAVCTATSPLSAGAMARMRP